MTRPPAPVILPDGSALLPDGTHVPAHAIRRAVDLIAAACAVVEALPPDVRVQLEAEAVVAEAEAVSGE